MLQRRKALISPAWSLYTFCTVGPDSVALLVFHLKCVTLTLGVRCTTITLQSQDSQIVTVFVVVVFCLFVCFFPLESPCVAHLADIHVTLDVGVTLTCFKAYFND